MKKIFLYIFLFLFFLPLVVGAHAPKDIIMEYDPEFKELRLSLGHEVLDPKNHYIYKAVISINGKVVFTDNFFEQLNKYVADITYYLPMAKKNDKIWMEFYCIQGGGISQKLDIYSGDDVIRHKRKNRGIPYSGQWRRKNKPAVPLPSLQ